MSQHNYEAGVQMSMASVVRNYLRWFELRRAKRRLAQLRPGADAQLHPAVPRTDKAAADVILDADLLPADAAYAEGLPGADIGTAELPAARSGQSRTMRASRGSIGSTDDDYADAS
jgi:hypothetical protein